MDDDKFRCMENDENMSNQTIGFIFCNERGDNTQWSNVKREDKDIIKPTTEGYERFNRLKYTWKQTRDQFLSN